MGKPVVNVELRPSVHFKKQVNSLFVSFKYNMSVLSQVKSLPEETRRYIPDSKEWEVDLSQIQKLVQQLESFDIQMKGPAHTETSKPVREVKPVDKTVTLMKFKTEPFKHQIEAFEYGRQHPKFILGDDQGLGKTKQAIDLAVSRKGEFKHCLIICGVNSVKFNWLKEIEIHSDEEGVILGSHIGRDGKLRDEGSLQDRLDDLQSDLDEFFLITNIETFRQVPNKKKKEAMSKQELLQEQILEQVEEMTASGKIGMVIIDEFHKAKNHASKQGQAIHRMSPTYKMALTGTPLVNSPLDLYNLLKWLEVENHSFYQFKNFYCHLGGWAGSDVVGYKNLDHLEKRLKGVMLRRLKKDVLDLPDKIQQREIVDLTAKQAKLYKSVRLELLDKIEEIVLEPNPLAMLTRLRQITSNPAILSPSMEKENPKMDRLEEMVEELVANGEKAIVFSNWSAVTEPVRRRLSKYNPAYIDGTVSNSERMDQVEKFQNDDSCKVIIGTIGAMGTGLTLTAASTVFFMDKPWNRATEAQAEDRAHRIGTKGTVNMVSLICRDTIDERIEELILSKKEMSDSIVDGKLHGSQLRSMVRSLLD